MDEPGETNKTQEKTGSRFREVLAQVLAMAACNMNFVTVTVIPSLYTYIIADLHNSKEELSMDDTVASWFGGMAYLVQPVGALAGGLIVQWLGRKRSLMIINVPYALGCILMSTAPNVAVLLVLNFLFGVVTGSASIFTSTYNGELYQPKLRGIFIGFGAIFIQSGTLLAFVLGGVLHWRTVAAILTVIPAMTFIFLSRIPESPSWLVAQGRVKDAEAALCWLRGWVEPSAVQQELADLVKYHESTKVKQNAELKELLTEEEEATAKTLENQEEKKKSRFLETMKFFMEPEAFRPLVLTVLFSIFCGIGNIYTIRPFLVEVLDSFHVPIEGKKSTIFVAIGGIVGSIITVSTISKVGKRKMALSSTAVYSACCLLLGLYAYLVIEPATRSGDESHLVATWIPLVLLVLYSLSSLVQLQVPWILASEVFPFRTRSISIAISSVSFSFIAFLGAKCYLSMQHTFQLYGTFWFFCTASCVLFIYLFFQLPETEGKSLQEIERLFAGNKRRST